MTKKIISAFLFLTIGITLCLLSCKKDIKEENPTDQGTAFAIPVSSPVNGSISGMVVDENNNPVNGATVNFGAASTTTNSRGLFVFNQVTMDKYITTVSVTNTGYFKAVRTFSATASRNFLNIKLIPKTLAGTVSSSAAEMVTLSNGTTVSFQANSVVVKASGIAYSGTVKVFASYIDPTSQDISSIVPGCFMGRDADNLYSLQSTGMIAVDLESDAGVPLQLATGMPATIKLPIPSSLLGKAPATIDTWSLNDQGIWQKEGTATKSGDYYTMQVSHFSFWNCDVPANAIYLTLHVQDQAGNALSNMLVSLTVPNNTTWWATTYGITDSAGNVSGLVPANQELVFNSYPNIYNCNGPINTQNIGPFTANTTLTVTATIGAAQTLAVSGSATDCNSQPLASGTAVIYSDMYGYTYTPITNGTYSAEIIHCSAVNSVSVTVIDNSSGAQANSSSVAVSGASVVIPSLSACGGTQTAVFIFSNGQGACGIQTPVGTYTAGTPLDGSNVIGVSVEVSVPGIYAINTTTTNGISFSATGVFSAPGLQTVFLVGSGTPVSGGSFTFQIQSGGAPGCTFVLYVNPAPSPQAVYDLGGPGACASTTIAGTYSAGFPVIPSNTVSFVINVISGGTYNITTSPVNGMIFSDTGFFATTGPRVVLLYAEGTPTNAGTFTYTPMASNGTIGCTFDVPVTGSGSNAVFTFEGAPSTCPAPVIGGTYTAGVPLSVTNTVTFNVEVTTIGAYTISVNSTNGMSFVASGTFTATGLQTVVMEGSGTPGQQGAYTFLPSGGGSTGCPFIIQVN